MTSPNHAVSPTWSRIAPWDLRLTRRALLAAAPVALIAACRGNGPTLVPSPGPNGGDQLPLPAPTPSPEPAEPRPSGTPESDDTPVGEQVFYQWGFDKDPISHDFNANLYCGGEPALWAGLLTLNNDGEISPDWAEAWESTRDGITWRFALRRDNHGWSNGDPVTAHDFIWSWQRQLLPETGAPYADLLFDIYGAQAIHEGDADPETLGVYAPDDWTLEVTLVGPRPRFLSILASIATVPAHRASVEAHGDRWTEAGNCVSNGPFMLTEWKHRERFETARNPNYWNAAAVSIDRVITPIISLDKGLAPYDRGAVDYVAVPGPDLPRLRGNSTIQKQLGRSVDAAIWCLIPQVNIPPYDDLRVRRAISLAIDRERIVQVSHGRALSAHSLVPAGLPGHFDDPELVQMQQFDVDAALAALDGTPYAGGQGWPPLTLTLQQADDDAELLAQDIAAQLRENLGMDITVEVMEPQAFTAALWNHERGLIWYRWWFDYADPQNGYDDLFVASTATGRRLAWNQPAFDDLVERARVETIAERRLQLYRECERLLQQDVAYIPVVYPVTWYLFKPWVQNIPVNRDGFWVPRSRLFPRMTAQLRIEGRPSTAF